MRIKNLQPGLYTFHYQIYEITLPYQKTFYFAGPKEDAEVAARKLKKKFKNPYQVKVKFLSGVHS